MSKLSINALMGGAIYRLQEQLLRRPTFTYLVNWNARNGYRVQK